MTGTVLVLEDYLTKDQLACQISDKYMDWESRRQPFLAEQREVMQYVFATDTTKTSNNKLPWSNKTTIPKLCQIRDNLIANYMMALFPKQKWMIWEGESKDDETVTKSKAIESYMDWVADRNEFYEEIAKLVADYVDNGNSIATVEWVDKRNNVVDKETGVREQAGYVGPMVRRIAHDDIVFNPASPDFVSTPKIIRTILSLGEVKELLERVSTEESEKEDAQELYNYLKDIRDYAKQHAGNLVTKDNLYYISGFDNFQAYLESNYVELITFYGDIYNHETGEFLRNQVIKVVDRHKILSQRTNTSLFGTAPIYHAGWRIRPGNLWAMGPLNNLVGMQYRIDHLENIKADVFDLFAYPPLEIKGYVEAFKWGPFEKIYVGDDGKVTPLSPDVQALQANTEIAILEQKMEEMSGSPREAMGFRSPGEKTKYEVQRLENAASRIFQNKINQFERHMVEPILNAMLELARRHMDSTTIRILDDELKIARFRDLTKEDITGAGRIKPIAARHFAEKAQQVQDLATFFGTPLAQDPGVRVHFSGLKLAKLMEGLLDLEQYEIVTPYIALTEQTDGQAIAAAAQEQMMMNNSTPNGFAPGDSDPNAAATQGSPGGMAQGPVGPGGPRGAPA